MAARWERSTLMAVVHNTVMLTVFVLLLLATLSAPMLRLGYLTVEKGGYLSTLGTFGWCRVGGISGEYCTGRELGYYVEEALQPQLSPGGIYNEPYYYTGTKRLLLVPVAAGVAGVATLTSLFARSSTAVIWSTLLGMLTSILATASVIINVKLFDGLRRELIIFEGFSDAHFGPAYYFVIVACAGSLFVTVLALAGCWVGMLNRSTAPKGVYAKVQTAGESARSSTYRQSAYEMPDLEAQGQAGEVGARNAGQGGGSRV